MALTLLPLAACFKSATPGSSEPEPPSSATTTAEQTLEPLVKALEASIEYDEEQGALNFTIPEGLPSDYAFNILVAGSVEMGEGSMSIHLFEEESLNNSWEPGKTYSHQFEPGSLHYITMSYGVQKKDNSEVLYYTVYDIDFMQPDEAPPEENSDVLAIKQNILGENPASEDPKLIYHGEYVVEDVECYLYSLYILMNQDDGTQINRAHRRISEVAISKIGDKYWYSADGTDWVEGNKQ